jgi:hypothetical protein
LPLTLPCRGLAGNVLVVELPADSHSLGADAYHLRLLSRPMRRRELSAGERHQLLQRVARRFPEKPSALLRLAAVAHRIDEGLDERLARAPADLAEWATRDPWAVEPDEAKTLLLASLVGFDQLDYESVVPRRETPMVLRDALTDPEDLATVAAMVRWEGLISLRVSTPDSLLCSWSTHVASIARDPQTWDPSEYGNTLNIRSHLQRFAAAISWLGLEKWREHIEPADDAFRKCTERQDFPLTLTGRLEPGEWWRYRAPVGVSEAFARWQARSIEPSKYVAGPRGGLKSISHVWELAEDRQPYGLLAMTDQELHFWASFCDRQADAEARSEHPQTTWRDRYARVLDEQGRRADDNDH